MKRIVLAGGSGFIGQALAPALVAKNYSVVIVGRGAPHREEGVDYLQWDGKTLGDWARAIDGAEGIVNLTGRNINCRHTPENRREIIRSRVDSVRVLGEAIANCAAAPKVFVQTSGVGYYGDTGDRVTDEAARSGNDFPAQVCRQWEGAFDAVHVPATRRIIIRLGVVLGHNGGALPVLEKMTRWFLGGAVGNGRQFLSWVHVADVIKVFVEALEQGDLAGRFNATAPAPVTNDEFMRELRRALRRPWSPPVPALLARAGAWFMGSEGSLALLSSRCVPRRFLEQGFEFQFPNLRDALANLYRNGDPAAAGPSRQPKHETVAR
ncbi:MAG TPA: TIGR01777 family oxidoreductase [Chthoniobacterales bacterium]|nr:TIGR01777 family oxidoreductase [Chthoniobacterales bacterium]